MILVFVVGTFGLNFQITTVLLARQVFHRTATGYGLLSTALAVGACVGAVLATRRRTRPSLLFLLLAALSFGLLEIIAGSMPGFGGTALLLVLVGLAMLSFTTAANSSVQLGVEATMRGRVMALYLMCFLGGTPLGAPIVGWVANTVGPRWGMIGGGVVCMAVAVGMALYLVRQGSLGLADVTDRWEKITSRY
jgi:MFS family permease